MNADKYDNQHLNIPVKSGKRLLIEVQNFSAFQQQLFALVEIEPKWGPSDLNDNTARKR